MEELICSRVHKLVKTNWTLEMVSWPLEGQEKHGLQNFTQPWVTWRDVIGYHGNKKVFGLKIEKNLYHLKELVKTEWKKGHNFISENQYISRDINKRRSKMHHVFPPVFQALSNGTTIFQFWDQMFFCCHDKQWRHVTWPRGGWNFVPMFLGVSIPYQVCLLLTSLCTYEKPFWYISPSTIPRQC